METAAAIRGRRAVRVFQDRSVARSTLEALLEAATWAPSPYNSQPWHFVVIQNRDLVQRAQASLRRTALWLWRFRWLLGLLRPALRAPHARQILEKARFQSIHPAPVFLLVCGDPSWPGYEIGCAAAVQNLLLAAWDQGLAGTHIGGAPLLNRDRTLLRRLGVPRGYRVVDALVLGYPARVPADPPPRKPVAAVSTWIA